LSEVTKDKVILFLELLSRKFYVAVRYLTAGRVR